MNLEINYILLNLSLFVLILLVCYLIITDNRFKLNRKILFILVIIILFGISFYINKAPYKIINDLFWYSLVLNGSFIFHTLICDRIFYYCWKNHYEYVGFLISRLSFTFSLSGLLYLLNKTIIKLYGINIKIQLTRKKKNYFIILIITIIECINLILLRFIIVFKNYELILLGINTKFLKINTNLEEISIIINKKLIKTLLFFFIFFIISIIINMPRLYIIWVFQFILESYNILNKEYQYDKIEFQKLKFKEKIINSYLNWGKTSYLGCSYSWIINKEIKNIYELPYHSLFMFDLVKFLDTPPNELDYDETYKEYNNFDNLTTLPILKVYKYYSFDKLAINYSGINLKNAGKDSELKFIQFSNLINKNNYDYIIKFLPNLSILEYNEINKIINEKPI